MLFCPSYSWNHFCSTLRNLCWIFFNAWDRGSTTPASNSSTSINLTEVKKLRQALMQIINSSRSSPSLIWKPSKKRQDPRKSHADHSAQATATLKKPLQQPQVANKNTAEAANKKMSQSEPRGLPEANQASNINSKGTRKRRKRCGGKQENVHRKQVQRGKARAKLLYQTRLSNQSSDNSDYGDMMRKKPNNKSFRIQFQNRTDGDRNINFRISTKYVITRDKAKQTLC